MIQVEQPDHEIAYFVGPLRLRLGALRLVRGALGLLDRHAEADQHRH